jgi:hypothetical protein
MSATVQSHGLQRLTHTSIGGGTYSRHLSDLQEPGISSCSSNQSHYVIMVCSFLGCVSGGLAEATSMVVYASVRHIQKSVREGSCLSVKEIF